MVDVWYDFPNGDAPGWRGPAQIVSVNLDKGGLAARVQGKTFVRRHQGVIVHVFYLVCSSFVVPDRSHQWDVARREVEC